MAEAKKIGRPATRNPARLDISVPEATRAKLEELAKSERRPMNYVVCSLLNQTLGIDEQDTPAPPAEAPKRQKDSNCATVMLNISLQSELKDAVKAIAKMERRTASNMACVMIRDWIEQWEAKHSGASVWGGEAES